MSERPRPQSRLCLRHEVPGVDSFLGERLLYSLHEAPARKNVWLTVFEGMCVKPHRQSIWARPKKLRAGQDTCGL